ncbi:hypothetical protein C8F01DRAFT_1105664, partial [Mycena amicta]
MSAAHSAAPTTFRVPRSGSLPHPALSGQRDWLSGQPHHFGFAHTSDALGLFPEPVDMEPETVSDWPWYTDALVQRSIHSPRNNTHQRLQIQDYDTEREGDWIFDAAGQTVYVPHGTITEMPDGDEDALLDGTLARYLIADAEELPLDVPAPPRPLMRERILLPLEVVDNLPLHQDFQYRSISPNHHQLPSKSYDHDVASSLSRNTTPPSILTQSQELQQHLMSLSNGSVDILSLHSASSSRLFLKDALFSDNRDQQFISQREPDPAALALCEQIGEALQAVRHSLERRAVEVWCTVGQSTGCSQTRYDARLLSLKRTLQKLHNLSSVSIGTLRTHQFTRLRGLLEQHRAKFCDLAHKFNTTFDRLHSRYIHNEIQRKVVMMKARRRPPSGTSIGKSECPGTKTKRRSKMHSNSSRIPL